MFCLAPTGVLSRPTAALRNSVIVWWAQFTQTSSFCTSHHTLIACCSWASLLPFLFFRSHILYHSQHEQTRSKSRSQQRACCFDVRQRPRVRWELWRQRVAAVLCCRATQPVVDIRPQCRRLFPQSVKERQHNKSQGPGRPASIHLGATRAGRRGRTGSMGQLCKM